jgi:hypothetical protein
MTKTCGPTEQGDSAEPCGCASRLVQLQTRKRQEPSPAATGTLGRLDLAWADGVVSTPQGDVPRARTKLTWRDRVGTLRARWAVGRMNYRVPPGLYAVGDPTPASPVLVSANYKLSFDRLRSVLAQHPAFILVLDTKGINVWCAAGKGTFGTEEMVRQVRSCGLERVVSHRKLVVPQLGAPGVAAHTVRRATGFHVSYGPVRAEDLPAFLDARMTALPEMRLVRFPLKERLVLVPVELVLGLKLALPLAASLLLLSGLNARGYSLASVGTTGVTSSVLLLASFLTAVFLGPALLPWLPGRAFSLKGAALGLAFVALLVAPGLPGPGLFGSWLHLAAWSALIPVITSFVVMNFTGTSTFTSLSGVLREMRVAVPAQIGGGVLGLVLWVTGLFVSRGPVR